MNDTFSFTEKELALRALEQATLNRIWARLILLALYRQGVRHFCIAPGSRSTPLTLEAQHLSEDRNDVTLHGHFDERGLGFLALGLAKGSLQPVAVIVTSGTAVANLLPAVAESALTGEPLILLTADRPCDQIQCGANQAIVQTNIFGEQVSAALHLPAPSITISPAWLLSTLSQKLALQQQRGASLHINCPYPEPLYGAEHSAAHAPTAAYLEPVSAWLAGDKPYVTYLTPQSLDQDALQQLWQPLAEQKGIVLIGNICAHERPALLALAQKLGWPVLCDPQAGLESDHAGFDGWLLDSECRDLLLSAQCILQFGARLVSQRLAQFLAQFHGTYLLVAPHLTQLDPQHHHAVRICAPCAEVAHALLPLAKTHAWAPQLKLASQRYFATIERACKSAPFSELSVARALPDWLLPETSLFIGNSLIIRLLDLCAKMTSRAVFANRGASGIDGLIATASGVARARAVQRQGPLLCVLGDLSALYDLNSLALLRDERAPVIVLVINNDGGGIFDLLPVPAARKEALYRMGHELNFAHAAAQFALPYFAPRSLQQAKEQIVQAQQTGKSCVIEIITPPGEAGELMQSLFAELKNGRLLAAEGVTAMLQAALGEKGE